MLAELLHSFFGGAGFMLGLLVIYTIYDFVYSKIEARQMTRGEKRRRKRKN